MTDVQVNDSEMLLGLVLKHGSIDNAVSELVKNNDLDTIKKFVGMGWNLDSAATYTGLLKKDRLHILKYLLEEVDSKLNISEAMKTVNDCIYWLSTASSFYSAETLRYLLDSGVYNQNTRDQTFYNMSITSNVEMMKIVYEYGVSAEMLTKTLDNAVSRSRLKVVTYLVDELGVHYKYNYTLDGTKIMKFLVKRDLGIYYGIKCTTNMQPLFKGVMSIESDGFYYYVFPLKKVGSGFILEDEKAKKAAISLFGNIGEVGEFIL